MKRLRLTRGKFALVDDADYEKANRHHWHACPGYQTWYARGKVKGRQWQLHRFLLQPPPGKSVDHVNGNALDNQRCNLRLCTDTTNAQNRRKFTGRVKYKGVKAVGCGRKPFSARITVDHNTLFLGHFKTDKEAAMAYDHAARKWFGQFARLNFPNEQGRFFMVQRSERVCVSSVTGVPWSQRRLAA